MGKMAGPGNFVGRTVVVRRATACEGVCRGAERTCHSSRTACHFVDAHATVREWARRGGSRDELRRGMLRLTSVRVRKPANDSLLIGQILARLVLSVRAVLSSIFAVNGKPWYRLQPQRIPSSPRPDAPSLHEQLGISQADGPHRSGRRTGIDSLPN